MATKEEILAKLQSNQQANLNLTEMFQAVLDYIDTQVTLAGVVTNLPTADPEVEGQLWNNTGTVTVSAGAP